MLATEQLKRSEVLRSNHRCFGRLLLLRFLFALIYSMGLPCSTLYSDPPDSAESKAQNESVKAYIRNFTPSGQTVVVGEKPRTPQESQQSFIVAQGLRIDLVASEPTIRQPVCLNFDERGRMWVVQYLQYPFPAGLKIVSYDENLRAVYDSVPQAPPHHTPGADKVTILEDTDGDGEFDSHKDFVDGLNIVTSALSGNGGVYVMNPPYLLFYADTNQDDVPDGDPQVMLSGFGIEDSHATANSLTWGPDGWLYGAQGSTCTATIHEKKIFGQFSWRFHPTTHAFEVFAEGAGNTYCLEFDEKGRLFSGTNYPNRRGSYYVQGGYYERAFAKHGPFTSSHTFGYFPHMQHQGDASRFSHSLIVYEGGALPAVYDHKLISLMPLQNRLQLSALSPDGSTFKTTDERPIVESTDKWFRPVDIKAGPDGAIYFADWYDIRLTHADTRDNWDRANGRIYRLRATNSTFAKAVDLRQLTSDQLIDNLSSPNKWLRQNSLRMLGERKDRAVIPRLHRLLVESTGQLALEALWGLNQVVGVGYGETIDVGLQHADPFVRAWTVRLVADQTALQPVVDMSLVANKLAELATKETDLQVRSQLACSARRLSSAWALPIVRALLSHTEDIDDPHIPLLLWWAVENKAIQDRDAVVAMFSQCEIWQNPIVAKHLRERLIKRYASQGDGASLEAATQLMANTSDSSERRRLLLAFAEGCQGQGPLIMPDRLRAMFREANDRDDWQMLMLRFELGITEASDWELATRLARNDNSNQLDARIAIINHLGRAARPGIARVLLDIINTSSSSEAVRAALVALQYIDDPSIADQLLAFYSAPVRVLEQRTTVVDVLSRRQPWANKLLAAVEDKRVQHSDVAFDIITRLRGYHDETLDQQIRQLWGPARQTDEAKQLQIARIEKIVSAESGDVVQGEKLFVTNCANCHILFGNGKRIGPDLTGYERDNLGFMLVSVIDPSAGIREEYATYQVATEDGLVLSGTIVEQTPSLITLLDSDSHAIAIPRHEIESMQASSTSRMPEGILDKLNDDELRSLFSYLRSRPPLPQGNQ